MASDGPDSREQRFGTLVIHAVEMGHLYDHLVQSRGHNQPVARHDMPSALLTEILHLTRLQFEALCHDLLDPWLSHAASTHLRPVLEGMAQLGFILGHETTTPVGTSRQRAACLALARARESHRAMVAASPRSVPDGNVEEGSRQVRAFEQLHEIVGCPYVDDPAAWPCREAHGGPCRHRELWPCKRITNPAPRLLSSPTLLRLSKTMSFPFTDLEQASSLVIHQSLIDRMMSATSDGTNALRNATYKERALTLAMALSAYGGSLGWVMETMDMPAAGALGRYASDTWRRDDLAEIMRDEWDKHLG